MRAVPLVALLSSIVTLAACAGNTEEPQPTIPQPPQEPAAAVTPEPKGAVDGKIDGNDFSVMDARVFAGTISERKNEQGIRIVLSAHQNLCASPDMMKKGERTISIDIAAPRGDLELVGVRTYSVPEPLAANKDSVTARLDARTTTCGTKAFIATEGTVTIEEVSKDHVRGKFDLILGRDHIQGSFDAPPCNADAVLAPPVATRCE
jgi:hypothetical protein